MTKTKLSIVFPAYNEEKNIEKAVSEAVHYAESFKDYEVVVVDDGSEDQTREKIEKLVSKNKKIKGIFHSKNQGYGAAVWDGLKGASGDLVFFTDSDLQFKIGDLKYLIEKIDVCDVVAGYRRERSEGFGRKLNVFLWQMALMTLLKIRFKDIDCAFKLFRKEVLKNLEIKSKGAMFSAELMYRIQQKGFKITQVPVDHYKRKFGKPTGANIGVVVRALKELMRFYAETRKERKAL
jgi:glycosyltransferase involved in cell wall biosynthesis